MATIDTMRAIRVHSSRLQLDLQSPIPAVGENEVQIRVRLAGICSTDLELVKGYFGFQGILGHEFVGIVESAKNVSWRGKRVVSSINFADPLSDAFKRFGFEHHPDREVLGILKHDGAMADYVVVPEANLFEVPESISDRSAVFVEPLAAAIRILRQFEQLGRKPSSLRNACVIGPGRLGMLIARVLQREGIEVQVLGRRKESLALAEKWGLRTGAAEDFPDSYFELSVDATGSPLGLQQAIRLTQPLGVLALKSTYAGVAQVDLTKVVVDEITLLGSRCGPFADAIELLSSSEVQVNDLIDAVYPVEEAIEAFQFAAQPGVRKVLINFCTE